MNRNRYAGCAQGRAASLKPNRRSRSQRAVGRSDSGGDLPFASESVLIDLDGVSDEATDLHFRSWHEISAQDPASAQGQPTRVMDLREIEELLERARRDAAKGK